MPGTYEPIATTTLSTSSPDVTFSSIPGTYTDLRIVFTGTTTVATSTYLRFNGDTASNYSRVELSGNGANATTSRGVNQTVISLIYTAVDTVIPTLTIIDVFGYAGSTFKTVLTSSSQDLNGSGNVGINVGMWRSTSAITSLSIFVTSDNLAADTTVTLYGILKA